MVYCKKSHRGNETRIGGFCLNIKQVLRPGLQQPATAVGRKSQKKTASPSSGRCSTDRASWSKQALAFVQEQNRIMWGKQPGGQEGGGTPDPMSMELKQQYNCLKIATRIQKGDKVPLKDLKYLRDADPKAYMMAIATRQEKRHPKEWKSVLDEEGRGSAAAEAQEWDAEGAESSGPCEGEPV